MARANSASAGSGVTARIDGETDQLITHVAHFLGRSKQSIIREAVTWFVEQHRELIDSGIVRAVDRIARVVPDGGTGAAGRDALVVSVASLPVTRRLEIQKRAIREECERVGMIDARVRASDEPMHDETGRTFDIEIVGDVPNRLETWDIDELVRRITALVRARVALRDALRFRVWKPDRYEEFMAASSAL